MKDMENFLIKFCMTLYFLTTYVIIPIIAIVFILPWLITGYGILILLFLMVVIY
jgi:hypothetical protein